MEKSDKFLCPICGGVLGWDSDSERPDGDESGYVSFYHCTTCGTSVEVYTPTDEEKEDYSEYWKTK